MAEAHIGVWGRHLGSILGFTLAGPGGAVIGKLAGGLVEVVFPGAGEIVLGVLANLTTDVVHKTGKSLLAKIDPNDKNRINHDLQNAFRQAFQEAVFDLGGKHCFPKAWKVKPREDTAGSAYFSTPEGSALWRNKDPLAEQICACLQEMEKQLSAGRILPLVPATERSAEDVRSYLEGELNWETNQLFNQQVLGDFFSQFRLLFAERLDFKRHLEQHLLDRTLIHLGEILKADTPAWRAFNRLLLEGLKDEVKGLSEGQAEILERLDLLLDKDNPAPLAQWSEGIATLITSVGKLEKHLDDRFAAVLAQAVAQHGEVLVRIDGLMVASGRIETKVDRVLKFLEGGRYVVEGGGTQAKTRATVISSYVSSNTMRSEGQEIKDWAMVRNILELLYKSRGTTEYISGDSIVKRLNLPRKTINQILDHLEADKAIQCTRKRGYGSVLEYYYVITDKGVEILDQIKL